MSLQEFRDYVTNSGVDFDILSIEQNASGEKLLIEAEDQLKVNIIIMFILFLPFKYV